MAAGILVAAALPSASGAFGPNGGTEQGSLAMPPNGDGTSQTSALPTKVKQGTISVTASSSDTTFFDHLQEYLTSKPSYGARVIGCVLLYSHAVQGGYPEATEDFTVTEPTLQLLFLHVCIQLARTLSQQAGAAPHALASSVLSSCPMAKRAAPVTIAHSGSGYSAHVNGMTTAPKSVGYRLSCSRTATSLKIAVKPTSRTANLKSAVGSKLEVAFQSGSSSSGTIKFSYTTR